MKYNSITATPSTYHYSFTSMMNLTSESYFQSKKNLRTHIDFSKFKRKKNFPHSPLRDKIKKISKIFWKKKFRLKNFSWPRSTWGYPYRLNFSWGHRISAQNFTTTHSSRDIQRVPKKGGHRSPSATIYQINPNICIKIEL